MQLLQLGLLQLDVRIKVISFNKINVISILTYQNVQTWYNANKLQINLNKTKEIGLDVLHGEISSHLSLYHLLSSKQLLNFRGYTEWAIKTVPTCQLIMSSKNNIHLK